MRSWYLCLMDSGGMYFNVWRDCARRIGQCFSLQRCSAWILLRICFGSHVRLGSEFGGFCFFGRRGHRVDAWSVWLKTRLVQSNARESKVVGVAVVGVVFIMVACRVAV
jgi:hypothetical protein